MTYAYEKLMEREGLTIKDLPTDARLGIEAINNIAKAIKRAELSKQEVSEKTWTKLRANDKWVCNEILDFIEDTNDNTDEMPYEEEEVIDEIDLDDSDTDDSSDKNKAFQIEKELEGLYNSGKKDWSANDIKQSSKILFDAIYETYHQNDAENGIETTRYSLIETEPQMFTLKKI